VSIDYSSSQTSIERFVNDLAKSLAAIPEQEVRGDSASGFLIDLGCSPDEVSLLFKPPSATSLIGSYPLRSMIRTSKGSNVVDVAVEVPADCLFKKAYLSYRYHARRALYLSVVSKHLSEKGLVRQELCAVKDDPTRPALLLFPSQAPAQAAKKASDRLQVPNGFVMRLVLVISHNAFVPSKLGPDRNSIRWMIGAKGKDADGSSLDLAPTPLYNTSLLQEMSFVKHHSLLHKTLVDKTTLSSPSRLAQGLLLVKLWAKRRSLVSPGGLDGHILAMLLAHLVQGGKISPLMTSLQMFRCVLHSLSDPSGLVKGLSMSREDPSDPHALPTSSSAHPPSISGFKKHGHSAVFLDPSGWLNLTSGMSVSSLAQVVMASKHALALLQTPPDPEEAFAAVFLTPTSPASSFDYHWKIQLPITSNEAKLQSIKLSRNKKNKKQAEALSSKKKRKHSMIQQEEEGDERGSKESTGICMDQVIWR
jgi:U3 small nucleolar RNA-associated protein 22